MLRDRKEIKVAINEARNQLALGILENPNRINEVIRKIRGNEVEAGKVLSLLRILEEILDSPVVPKNTVEVEEDYLAESNEAFIDMAFTNLKSLLVSKPPQTIDELIDLIRFKMEDTGLRLPQESYDNVEELPLNSDITAGSKENMKELEINGISYRVVLIENKKRVIVTRKFKESEDPGNKMTNLYDKWIPYAY